MRGTNRGNFFSPRVRRLPTEKMKGVVATLALSLPALAAGEQVITPTPSRFRARTGHRMQYKRTSPPPHHLWFLRASVPFIGGRVVI